MAETVKMGILVAVTHDKQVMLQMTKDDLVLGHMNLDREIAMAVAQQIIDCAQMLPESTKQ